MITYREPFCLCKYFIWFLECYYIIHGPLARYVKSRVAQRMPGTFSPPTGFKVNRLRCRHESRHARRDRYPTVAGKTFLAHAQLYVFWTMPIGIWINLRPSIINWKLHSFTFHPKPSVYITGLSFFSWPRERTQHTDSMICLSRDHLNFERIAVYPFFYNHGWLQNNLSYNLANCESILAICTTSNFRSTRRKKIWFCFKQRNEQTEKW